MGQRTFLAAAVCLLAALAGNAQTTWYVNANAPSGGTQTGSPLAPFGTIQQAIDAVVSDPVNPEIILVADGVYPENLDLSGKSLHLRSVNGPGFVTVAPGNGSALLAASSEGPTTMVEGITFAMPPGAASPIFASPGSPNHQQILSTVASGARQARVHDLDGDGDNDVVSVSLWDNKLACYENIGFGIFGPQQVISTECQGPVSLDIVDVDGDSDPDILVASALDSTIGWFENLGGLSFGSRQNIWTAASGASGVKGADIDGDGDMDVLSSSQNDNKISWYENQGGGVFSGVAPHIISLVTLMATGVQPADLDNDGDLDVLTSSWSGNRIAWHENLGNASGSTMYGTQQIISVQTSNATSVAVADLDGDGDLDVLSSSWSDNKIAWYENLENGSGLASFGPQQLISLFVSHASDVTTADLDADGDLDVLSTSHTNDEVAWYENLGNASGIVMFGNGQIITSAADGARSVTTGDMDDDGDVDVVSVSEFDAKVAWYEAILGQAGLVEFLASSPVMKGCLVRGSSGVGIEILGMGSPVIDHCTITENDIGISAAVANCQVVDSIIWGNTTMAVNSSTIVATYSDIEGGYPGLGNLDSDPLFVDVSQGDYRVPGASPCAGTASNGGGMGAFDVVYGVVYPGSGEDLVLGTGVNGVPLAAPPIKQAFPGDGFFIRVDSPFGTYNNQVPFIVGELFQTGGGIPTGPPGFPEIQVSILTAFLLYDGGNVPYGPGQLPPGGLTLGYTIPLFVSGYSILLQGGCLSASPLQGNPFFTMTDGHEIQVQ